MSKKLAGESISKTTAWNKKLIAPASRIPVIEADPETYSIPENHHTVTLGKNVLWVASNHEGSWRGERLLNLNDPEADLQLVLAIGSLQTMLGKRYMLFTEQDETVHGSSSPQVAERYIELERAYPSIPMGVADTGTEEWHLYSGIPAGTTILVDDNSSVIRAFEATKQLVAPI